MKSLAFLSDTGIDVILKKDDKIELAGLNKLSPEKADYIHNYVVEHKDEIVPELKQKVEKDYSYFGELLNQMLAFKILHILKDKEKCRKVYKTVTKKMIPQIWRSALSNSIKEKITLDEFVESNLSDDSKMDRFWFDFLDSGGDESLLEIIQKELR